MLRQKILQYTSRTLGIRGRTNIATFSQHCSTWWKCLEENCSFKLAPTTGFRTISGNKYHTEVCCSCRNVQGKSRVRKYSLVLQCHRNTGLIGLPTAQSHQIELIGSRMKSDCNANNKTNQTDQRTKREVSNDGVIAKFKEIVNTFWLGCKQLLWIDARKAWATKNKLKRHDYDLTILTREELRHMRQTQKDIIKSLPVALLFFVPFIGYFAPVLGYLFPKRLLSPQFWDIEQQKKFAFEDHAKRSQYYLPLVQELGWSSRELKNYELFQLCIKVIDGNHVDNEEILDHREIFNVEMMTIKKMPRYHLVKLCKTWLLPVKWYVPSRVLREFLSYRIKQIIEDDAAMRRDGINILSEICIRQACHARGLDKFSFAISVMKEWLEEWMKLTESLSKEDKSFIAHCAAIKTMNFNQIINRKETVAEKHIDKT